ncbi:type I-C CRISPR-associated protein Cas8c/Csd1 [Clostridium minihomine]|uniref:type I-C CRISPR-associated protein Cas8c/Csd1 n=1 Tax=Clostridium minihomine TaxID=2045012 RepID=UPI000C7748FC|nr:type I-C CRISPR-associated protein Cas8c/Csd1 [Clostridium minihomine]
MTILKGEYKMLEKDRSYLFGRLLAILEYTATLAEGNDIRVSQYANRYTKHPRTTFAMLERRVMTDMYRKLTIEQYDQIQDLKAEIIATMDGTDAFTDEELTESYLLGYYMQRPKMVAIAR